MDPQRLCESDFRFMSVIWDNEPVSSGELAKICLETLGWKKSTVYTMIKKLSEKGFAANDNGIVTSLIPRTQVEAAESAYVVNETFGGALDRFLCAFLSGKKLSEKEAEELQKLIDQHREVNS